MRRTVFEDRDPAGGDAVADGAGPCIIGGCRANPRNETCSEVTVLATKARQWPEVELGDGRSE